MFVELENGELLNLDCVVRIFAETPSSGRCKVTAEYVRGGTVLSTVIRSGNERDCKFTLNTLRNSLALHGLPARE